MAEDDAAERPGEEADGIGGERRHRARERVERGAKQLVEDQGGGRPVQEEIVPFDGRADKAGEHQPPDRRRGPYVFVHAWVPDYRPAHHGFEIRVSSRVTNSTSAGRPSPVSGATASSARRRAGVISDGSVTRSATTPRAWAIAA